MYYIVRFTFLATLALQVVSLVISQSYYVNIFVTITGYLDLSAFYGSLKREEYILRYTDYGEYDYGYDTSRVHIDFLQNVKCRFSGDPQPAAKYEKWDIDQCDTETRNLIPEFPHCDCGWRIYPAHNNWSLDVDDVDDGSIPFAVVVSHDLVSVQYNILKSYFKGSDHSRYYECLPMKAANLGQRIPSIFCCRFILELRKFNDISRPESGLVENSRSRPFSLNGAVFELGADLQMEKHGIPMVMLTWRLRNVKGASRGSMEMERNGCISLRTLYAVTVTAEYYTLVFFT
ncbi:hypothetical protein M422DRAFT_47189 [Sphaerobolus stellatus SS14]|uniref:Uncharacterized protein n=1 Tax=Sphaerobolus stellatus (strain SS14) TaxID=990650 RepID=A0A0C9VR26_SPHS4|nr:hypothetical protein M422DRAFT_47189 [Sphaerobolus stellatus SS14]